MRIFNLTAADATISAQSGAGAAFPNRPRKKVSSSPSRLSVHGHERETFSYSQNAIVALLTPPTPKPAQRINSRPEANLMRRIVITPASVKVAAFVVAQQIVVGASNIFLVSAQAALLSGGPGVALYAGLFLASLLVPYIPGAASIYYTEKWKHEAALCISETTLENHAGVVSRLADNNAMRRASAHVASEGRKVAAAAIDGWAELLGLTLNVVTTLSVLSYLLNPIFGAAYVAGGLFGGLIVWLAGAWQQEAARRDHHADLRLTDTGESFSQNVVVGNADCQQRWERTHRSRLDAWSEASLRSLRRGRGTSLAATFATALPILTTVAVQLAQSAHNPAMLGALLVSLPRLIITMSYLECAISAAISNVPAMARLRETCNLSILTPDDEWVRRITPEKLEITRDGKPVALADVCRNTGPRKPGYWRVEGPNGAGKSTLLLALKGHWGAGAFYLPAHPKLLIASQGKNSASAGDDLDRAPAGSTGQTMMQYLEALLHLSNDIDVVLLDEPMGNLDQENQARARAMIEVISTRHKVVEVRHAEETS